MSLGEAVHSCQAGFPIPAKTAGSKCLVKDGCLPHPSRHARAGAAAPAAELPPLSCTNVADPFPQSHKTLGW